MRLESGGGTQSMTLGGGENSEERIAAARRSFQTSLTGDEVEIERIPGAAHPINRGLDGLSVRLRQDASGRHLFLKILDRETVREAVFADAQSMAAFAAAEGIGPGLIASDEATGAFLYEGLTDEWRFGTVKAFRQREIRETAITLIKALHDGDPLGSQCTLFDRIRAFQVELGHLSERAPDSSAQSVYPEFYASMSDWVGRIEEAFDAAGFDPAACHVENSLSNFMIGPSGDMKVVDFDRAANGDPLSDIGALCNEFCRTDLDIAEAAEIYAGRAEPTMVARIKLHMIASAFHLGLWGVVSQHRSPNTPIEFFKYGQNQFLRCMAAISRWDVGSLLREM